MKNKELALCLKVIDVIAVLGCALLLIFIVPIFASHVGSSGPNGFSPFIVYPIASRIAAFVLWIPLLAMGIICWSIFTRIAANRSFCQENSTALRCFSFIALAECLLLVISALACLTVGAYSFGLLALLVLLMFICLALSAIGAALSHLTFKASQIQDENDLTV